MNVTDISHKQFIDLFSNETFKEQVKLDSRKFVDSFERLLKNNRIKDKRDRAFIDSIILEAKSNFYLIYTDETKIFTLVTRNFKGTMLLGHNRPNIKQQKFYIDHETVIELTHIHSAQKGEGHKMMKRLLKVGKNLKIPITLLTETEDKVTYFENYGFKNFGRLGDNKEFLMIKEENY